MDSLSNLIDKTEELLGHSPHPGAHVELGRAAVAQRGDLVRAASHSRRQAATGCVVGEPLHDESPQRLSQLQLRHRARAPSEVDHAAHRSDLVQQLAIGLARFRPSREVNGRGTV